MKISQWIAAAVLLLGPAGHAMALNAAAAPLTASDFTDDSLRFGATRGSGVRSDVFVLAPGPSELTVTFKFFTSEFDPYHWDQGQNDFAMFGIFDPALGVMTPLMPPTWRGVLDPNTGLIPLDDAFVSPRGDVYTSESSAIELLLDVPAALGGHNAYVVFAVFDVGDTLAPTGALVGGFSQPVPGAYFAPDVGAFLGSAGGVSGWVDWVPTENLPAGLPLDGYSGTLPLLSTGGVPIPECGTLSILLAGLTAGMRPRRRKA